jgi:MoaA/NifB/PqqE/SkfB family radical SAM enzyme
MRLNTIFQNLKTRSSQPKPAATGLFHYLREAPGERIRIHLRVDPDGSGLLLVNASRVLHLNPTAALMAKLALEATPPEKAIQGIQKAYQVPASQASADYTQFCDQLDELVRPDGACPLHELEVETVLPFSARPSAPYRMDLALTYRCNNDCAHCYNARPRSFAEQDTAHWKLILDRVWEQGIPHVVFTGGEPTLRDDLPELVTHAEKLGQVSGLLSDGLRLADEVYLGKLLLAGLDHLMIVLDPENEQSWQAVGNTMVEDLSVAVHLTLTSGNREGFIAYLERLAGMGVRQVSLSTVAAALANDLRLARERLAALNLELVWNLPVPYYALHPVALETSSPQLEGAGRAWLYLEPDGDVRPSQGDKRLLGNFLNDSWEKIWKGAA